MIAALTDTGMILPKQLSVGNRLMSSKTAMLDVDGTANITGNVTIGGTITAVNIVNSSPNVFYGYASTNSYSVHQK